MKQSFGLNYEWYKYLTLFHGLYLVIIYITGVRHDTR